MLARASALTSKTVSLYTKALGYLLGAALLFLFGCLIGIIKKASRKL